MSRSIVFTRRPLVLAGLLACAWGCREAAPTTTPEPAPSPTPTAPARTEAPRKRGPEEVVAIVDGVEIREADVARLARVSSTSPAVPPAPRAALVLQLVERQLVAREAERLYLEQREEDIDRALETVATSAGLTLEELRAAVSETMAMSWEEYREEVAVQILEMRLIMTSPGSGSGNRRESSAEVNQRFATTRARVVGCLRARAKVSIEDETVELPANPFAIAASMAALRWSDDPVLPEGELEAAAMVVASGQPLCDSLAAAEVAMTQLYMDRGYLDARVRIPWPEAPGTMTLDVEVEPGPLHVLGEITFDQRAVPKAERVKEKELRRKLAALGKAGDVATQARLQGITERVNEAFAAAGVEQVMLEVTEQPAGEAGVQVDLRFWVPTAG